MPTRNGAASQRTPGQPALQLTADNHLTPGINAVDLKYRLGDVETDCRDCLHDWLLRIVGALTAPTSMALACRWRSRPQHQLRTSRIGTTSSEKCQKETFLLIFSPVSRLSRERESPITLKNIR